MLNLLWKYVAGLILVLFSGFAAQAEPRIALVIGNGGYEHVNPLDNPPEDARLVSATLVALGFKVTLIRDASLEQLAGAVSKFGRDLREAGPEATGLFYYAGHGVQSFGSNFLVPIDASLTDAADLGLVALDAETVLRQMSSAKNHTNIVILDACRNNPFETVPDLDDTGLAEMKAPRGTYLAYSTAPGAVALDGLSANSPFTAAFAALMSTPGLPIEQMFKQVRNRVLEETNGAQTPWDASSLTTDFSFSPAMGTTTAGTDPDQAWDSVKVTKDPIQIMLFMRSYPDSPHSAEAKTLLASLLAQELKPATSAAPASGGTTSEEALIAAAQASGKAEDYQAYLDAFPTGTFAELVKTELAALADKGITPKPDSVPLPDLPEVAAGSITFAGKLAVDDPVLDGHSLETLIAGTPLFPPIDGLPDEVWKDHACKECHQWTEAALCDQSKTYVTANAARSLGKAHPLGLTFKQVLKQWGAAGCP